MSHNSAPALRIERLVLKHVKKIESLVVQPNAAGVTVIHGDNESGKSTIIEAFGMLISDTKLKSTKAEVKALKPIGSDEKPYVEATMRIGDYSLTYSRTFAGASSKATLQIHEPRVHNVTGTEAFDKFREILSQYSDDTLRSAMSIEQGDILNLSNLFEKNNLSRSLSRAGASDEDPSEELSPVVVDDATQWLMEAAREEREKYFTPRSQDTWVKSFKEKYEELQRAEQDVADAHGRLKAAEGHSERIEKSQAELIRIAEERTMASQRAEELDKEQQKVQEHAAELARAEAMAAESEDKLQKIVQDIQRRTELRDEIDELLNTQHAAQEAVTLVQGKAAAQEKKAEHQRALANADRLEQNLAIATRELVRAHQDVAAKKKQRQGLQEQQTFAAEVAETRSTVQKRLDSNPATPENLSRVLEAHQEWQLSVARRDLAATAIDIEGPQGSVIHNGKEEIRLEDGGYHSKVSEHRTFKLGDFTIGITPAGNAVDHGHDVSQRRDRLVSALVSALEDTENSPKDCSDDELEQLIPVVQQRAARYAQDQAKLTEAQSQLRAALGHRTMDDLKEGATRLEAAVEKSENFVQQAEATVASEYEVWEQAWKKANEASEEVTTPPHDVEHLLKLEEFDDNWLHDIRGRLDQAEENSHRWLEDIHRSVKKAENHLSTVSTTLSLRQKDLAEAEQKATLSALQESEKQAEQEVQKAAEVLRERQQELSKLPDPELVNSKLQGKKEQLRTLDSREKNADNEILIAQHELEQAGGTAEEVQVAEASHQRLLSAFDSAEKRANAANLLVELFAEVHEEVKSHFQAPFLNEFTKLAKNIFGNDVSFELDGDMAITTRITDGVDIPLAQLSGGATEQIAMLYRLAAASLMGEGESVPIFLDDTLGYTDADRAENMNAVLSMMGKQHQIIVTTCDVSRFSAIHDAQVLSIESLQQ